MAEDKVAMTYTGTGGENWDVGREVGGSAIMEPGETYEVSEDLAGRLLLTSDWSGPSKAKEEELVPGPDATDGAKVKAEELGVDLASVEGTGQEGRITVPDVEKHADEQGGGE